jgi:dihydrofolate reductase
MGSIIAEITMSLDGFIAGSDITAKDPMGINGESLHEWLFAKATAADKAMLAELTDNTGAVILGHRTYSIGLDPWGGVSPFKARAFVLCHQVPSKSVSGFEYVTGGIHEALAQAKKAAGEKNVWVMGGANVIQQYLKAGLINEFHLHIAPVLLMKGTRLFDNIGNDIAQWEKESVTETPGAVHMRFKIK